jgi:anti-sigma factor RsiW
MIVKKDPNPVERILAWLDEGPEIENYAIHEIEALPIEEVRQRLDELGIDSALPGYINSFTASYALPARKILDALDHEVDQLSPQEIEHLSLEEVQVRLNSMGLNYRAGIHKIRELTGATSGGQPEKPPSMAYRIWAWLKMAVIGSLSPRRSLPFPSLKTFLSGSWVPVAASLSGLLLVGGVVAYGIVSKQPAGETAAAENLWLDNAAGYFKLVTSAGDSALVDVPATGDAREALQKISQGLPHEVRLPDLKSWGLTFRGTRLVVAEGRPAAQLVYTTHNKAIGPLSLIIGSSKQPDISPTFNHRQDVNLLYWRHQGRAYALVGQASADIGYLWGIANDVAWQLDAI